MMVIINKQPRRNVGHFVGMTCGREWALVEELCLPYVLVLGRNQCQGESLV